VLRVTTQNQKDVSLAELVYLMQIRFETLSFKMKGPM